MSTDKTQTQSNELQETFIAATQQAQAYREKLKTYQASSVVPDEDSKAMFEAIESALSSVSSALSLFGAPTSLTPSKSVVAQQDIPNQEELVRLSRIRDKTFFDYMRSLNLDNDIEEEVDAFKPNHTHLTAADELTIPYRRASMVLNRKLEQLKNEITHALQAQKTWLDFIIESIVPSFLLKLIDYLDFQDFTKENVRCLSEEFEKTAEALKTITEQFHENWDNRFHSQVPRDLTAASSITLSKLVYNLDHTTLNTAFIDYDRRKSAYNLTNLYRLVCQLQIQSTQRSEEIALEIRSAQLDGIIKQLILLHPDMLKVFNTEKEIMTQEMSLLAAYGQLPELNIVEQDIHNQQAKFIDELFNKYRRFLTNRNTETFRDLYHHIHHHPQYKHVIIVNMTNKLLKTVYPDAYKAVRQHQIANIDETLCKQFIKKYESLKYDNFVYIQLLDFVREPTSGQLLKLEFAMYSPNEHEHYLDPRLSSAVDDFMQICNSISSATTIEDQSSDSFSEVGGEERGASHDRSDSMDNLTALMLEENQEDRPKLSTQNLHEQNMKFALGHNSFFNPAHSQQVRTDATQMLTEYLAYQAELQGKLDKTLAKIEAIRTEVSREKSTGIIASIAFMASVVFYPLVALASLFVSDCQPRQSILSLSNERNSIKLKIDNLKENFEDTWEEKFGTAAPTKLDAIQTYVASAQI